MIEGLRIGHWTGAATGVIVAPAGTVGSGEVRGGAPATRELAMLDPSRTVGRVDAVVLTGGSAFGLAAADGVMQFLAARGQGFATSAGVVPIVPTAAIFDLTNSSDGVPVAAHGHAAAVAALRGTTAARGRVGAGRGATVGKWRGREHAVAGGLGIADVDIEGATVCAIAAVNAVGDVVAADGAVLAGSRAHGPDEPFAGSPFGGPGENTTLVVVATDVVLDKIGCLLVAQSAHDGLARAIRPAHTRFDGDLAIALATGTRAADPSAEPDPGLIDRVRMAAADATEAAIRDAVAPHPEPAIDSSPANP
jgi:L-aminopeptidase/D-esterase-like protein